MVQKSTSCFKGGQEESAPHCLSHSSMEEALPLPQAAGAGGGEHCTSIAEHVPSSTYGSVDGVLEGHEETETVWKDACSSIAEHAPIPCDDLLGRTLAREEEAAREAKEPDVEH
jgi:hypothetical protein